MSDNVVPGQDTMKSVARQAIVFTMETVYCLPVDNGVAVIQQRSADTRVCR